jgi:hypothetical protein
MTKTKIILVVLALSLVVMAAVGVTYAQSVNIQNQNNANSQTPAQGYNGIYGCYPFNAANGYPQNPQQGAYPYRMGMGMMYGRGW